ncbi:hypothetical protein RRG08_016225 [Elysia crispata]|uniref:Uncharacterized protein n=1 Tax=Elysia crispata TaxID=231223 RepID=A0AAE0ZPR0_9GAST|nr:hypothetical protein RRG08_016225 [Elysia crispata]
MSFIWATRGWTDRRVREEQGATGVAAKDFASQDEDLPRWKMRVHAKMPGLSYLSDHRSSSMEAESSRQDDRTVLLICSQIFLDGG